MMSQREDNSYYVIIGDTARDTHDVYAWTSSWCPPWLWERKRKRVYCKHIYYLFRFLSEVDNDNNKDIHALMSTYNHVMRLLELAGVLQHKWWCQCYVHPDASNVTMSLENIDYCMNYGYNKIVHVHFYQHHLW